MNRKILVLAILTATTQVVSADVGDSMGSRPGTTTVNTLAPTVTSRQKGVSEGMLEKTITVVYFVFAGATVAAGATAIFLHKRRNDASRR